MSASRSAITSLLVPFVGRWRSVTFFCVGLTVLVLMTVMGWKHYRTYVVSSTRFRLDKEHVEITPVPAWIQSDLKSEVMRDGSLSGISLLDYDAAVHIADAFSLHDWVKQVKRVSKHPSGKVRVELVYRQPVAMVRVDRGVFPVDADGVVLPVKGFVPEASLQFAYIDVGQTWPVNVGVPWGNSLVTGAARIAAAFGAEWNQLGLYEITLASPPPGQTRATPSYVLSTRSGLRIHWGHAPEKESQSEVSAADKVARLIRFAKERGELEQMTDDVEIDLRSSSGVYVTPHTTRLPGKPFHPSR